MPGNLDHSFQYDDLPVVPVRIICHETAGELVVEAMIDTGSDVTIFDADVARMLRLDLTGRLTVRFRGIGGQPIDAPFAELELMPLFEPELSVTLRVAFVPRILPTVNNLIGRDVLEYLDFALTHSKRTGYLGRTEALE
jgi:hypothetical protein